MTTFNDIKTILDAAVSGVDVRVHGPFWRALSREQFIAFKVFGGIPLVHRDAQGAFHGRESNLVLALSGLDPFGRDVDAPDAKYRRMPAGLPQVPADKIKVISDWIDEGCPE